ncbi:hypothetical protein [Marinoscillum pacificum]|uniref:hypothetical protein n=1 Tax=Marinoscillum pacificum TaxID=392723 RepID=UPI0021570941|nr:hypothetical protein [Marinoscillum pacificum]
MTALDTIKQQVSQLPTNELYSLKSFLNHEIIQEKIMDVQRKQGMQEIRTALKSGYQF